MLDRASPGAGIAGLRDCAATISPEPVAITSTARPDGKEARGDAHGPRGALVGASDGPRGAAGCNLNPGDIRPGAPQDTADRPNNRNPADCESASDADGNGAPVKAVDALCGTADSNAASVPDVAPEPGSSGSDDAVDNTSDDSSECADYAGDLAIAAVTHWRRTSPAVRVRQASTIGRGSATRLTLTGRCLIAR